MATGMDPSGAETLPGADYPEITHANLGDLLVLRYSQYLRTLDEADEHLEGIIAQTDTRGKLELVTMLQKARPIAFRDTLNMVSPNPLVWPEDAIVRVETLPGSPTTINQLADRDGGNHRVRVNTGKTRDAVEGRPEFHLDDKGGRMFIRSSKWMIGKLYVVKKIVDKEDDYTAAIKLTYL